MRNKRLGYVQRIQLSQYEDCVKRTRKKIDLSGSQKLVRFMLEESSTHQHENSDDGRSYHETAKALQLINQKLCPGTWCTRAHCEHYSSHRAYNCEKTRPTVCKIYKKYIEKQKKRNDE